MSVRVMASVWSSAQADTSELLLLLALADRAGDDGVAWPPVNELSRKCRLSERHILRLLSVMSKDGRLQTRKVQRGRRRHSVYRLNVPGLYEVEYDRMPFAVEPLFDDMTPRHIVARRHDTGGTDDMTPHAGAVKEKPSKNHQKSSRGHAPAPGPEFPKKVRDDLWDALVLATGINPQSIGERSRFGKSVVEILRAGGTAEEVPARARRYTMKYQGAALTDRALANRWGELGSRRKAGQVSEDAKCPECDLSMAPKVLIEHRYTSHAVGFLCSECGTVSPDAKSHKCPKTG